VAGSPVMIIAGGQVIAEDGRLLSEPGRGRVLDRAVDPAERREA
jgi:dihydropyrimidinase